MRSAKFILAVLATFGLGFLSASLMNSSWFVFKKDLDCISEHVCVGDEIEFALIFHRSIKKVGGLTNVFCGEKYGDDVRLLSLSDLLRGSRCERDSYALIFANSRTRTVVTIKAGRIEKITRGPLHVIDL